ncbi:MAG: HupE/UreJ family protein [Pseudomonadota bacterium]
MADILAPMNVAQPTRPLVSWCHGLHFAVLTWLMLLAAPLSAHPDDEFCIEGGLDPMLCSALGDLDRANGDAAQANDEYPLETRGGWATFTRYLSIGVQHIVPGGADHILFVIGLLLGVTRRATLLWLITAFTVAHGVALVAAVVGGWSPPALFVEAAIAATIAWVGLENLIVKPGLAWRYTLVFVFGLIHGFGFAGFIQDLGLPKTQLAPALLGFNLGVEIGQIAVVGVTALVVLLALRALPQGRRDTVTRWLRVIGSLEVALIGSVWLVERLATA